MGILHGGFEIGVVHKFNIDLNEILRKGAKCYHWQNWVKDVLFKRNVSICKFSRWELYCICHMELFMWSTDEMEL